MTTSGSGGGGFIASNSVSRIVREKERDTKIENIRRPCAQEEVAVAAEAEEEEVVRAWREGKTRFARQRLVSRQEFRLKISVVSVVGCVRSARCTV